MIFDGHGSLQTTETFARKLYNRRIQKNTDAVIGIIGGEGVGKSTYILQWMCLWRSICWDVEWGEFDYDDLFERIYSTRQGVQRAMVKSPQKSVIAIPDAGRVLFRKESVVGEQRELEKDFFDVRSQNYVFLLGFQDWKQIPDFLASRRLRYAFYIPWRGEVWGYGRDSLDERAGEGRGKSAWPEPDMTDTFPSLEGSDLWEQYQEFDEEEKLDRMGGDNQDTNPKKIKKREQAKIVLRMVKPWDDDGGMTYREAAKYTDYSESWISKRVAEWKEGDFDEVKQDSTRNPQTA